MADPLSITASIIDVIGAAKGVSKTINKIRNFRDAPNELLSLINEISDLRIVLGDIQGNLTQNASSIHLQEQSEHMSTLLNRAKEQLLQLNELVQYRLVRSDSTSQQVKISRQEWARATSMVKKYQKSLRNTVELEAPLGGLLWVRVLIFALYFGADLCTPYHCVSP